MHIFVDSKGNTHYTYDKTLAYFMNKGSKKAPKQKLDQEEVIELVAQIFLTMLNCEPDFDNVTMNDVMEFLGVNKRERSHMYRLVLTNQALRLIYPDKEK